MQAALPDGGTGIAAHVPSPSQIPVQHCEPAMQVSPTEAHEPAAQVPPTHLRLQHSAPSEHSSDGALQKAEEVHFPAPQVVEQQSPSDAQSAPPAKQLSSHFPPLQLPEQQSLVVEHCCPAAMHSPAGSTHTELAHAFVQQSEFDAQVPPAAWHWLGWTHVPLHAPEQHSEGSMQAASSASHESAAAAPQAPAEHAPVQHSEAAEQEAPSARHAAAFEGACEEPQAAARAAATARERTRRMGDLGDDSMQGRAVRRNVTTPTVYTTGAAVGRARPGCARGALLAGGARRRVVRGVYAGSVAPTAAMGVGALGWVAAGAANWNNLDTHFLVAATHNYPTTGDFKWSGPYAAQLPNDPWGHPYMINARELGQTTNPTWVLSAGPNGVIETTVGNGGQTTPQGDDIGFRIR